jgi:hypothetical protein
MIRRLSGGEQASNDSRDMIETLTRSFNIVAG